MRTNKSGWMAAALAALVAVTAARGAEPGEQPPAAQGTAPGERAAARMLTEAVKARMAGAESLQGKALTLLPVRGDTDGYLDSLLLDAMVQAGLTTVIPNDERDVRFKRILKEIAWDEQQTRLATIDPSTIDELGHLLSTQVLLEGRLMKNRLPVVSDKRGRPAGWAGADGAGPVEMELHLFAYEILTKRYVWTAVVTAVEPPPFGPDGQPGAQNALESSIGWSLEEALVPLNVGVKVTAGKGSDLEADLVDTYARGRLADLGYRVSSGKPDDMTLSLETSCELFDQKWNQYLVYQGTLKATLAVKGGDARELGSASFAARGARGLGEAQAHRNLADDMDAQLGGWLKRTLNPDAVDFAAVRLKLALAGPIMTKEDFKAIEDIQKGLAGLPGVRSARVEAQDNARGTLEFLVVFERSQSPAGVWNSLWAAHPKLLDALK